MRFICTIIANEKYCSINVTTFKRDITKVTISDYKYLVKDIVWTNVLGDKNASEAYNSFLSKFTGLYNIVFMKKEVKIKTKKLMGPWIKV